MWSLVCSQAGDLHYTVHSLGVQKEDFEMRYQFIDRKQMLFVPQSPCSSLSEVQPVELPLLESQTDTGLRLLH